MDIFKKKPLRRKSAPKDYTPRRRLSQENSPIAPINTFKNRQSFSSTSLSKKTSKQPPVSLQNRSVTSSFSRNRTIGVSANSRVASADVLNSPRGILHALVRSRQRVVVLLVIFSALSLLFATLLFQYTAKTHIAIAGVATSAEDQDRYHKIFDEYFSQNPMQRFRFLLDRGKLMTFLQTKAPELADFESTKFNGLGASELSFSARKALASWQIGQTVLFVDSNGASFTRNYFDKPSVLIVDNSNLNQQQNIGAALASSQLLSFVGLLVHNASQMSGMEIEKVVLPQDATRQIEVYFKGASAHVKMSIDRSVAEQVEDVIRANAWFKEQGLTPSYFDVRVKQKVYYQ